MRFLIASLVSASMMLGLPSLASGQTPARHARAQTAPAAPLMLAGADADSVLPVWQDADGHTLTVVTGAQALNGAVPGSAAGLRSIDAHSATASTGLQFDLAPGLYG